MSRDERDIEPEATAAEKTEAEAFGRLVDDLMAGQPPPPAMDSDQRALVEAATVVVASNRVVEMDPVRVDRLIDRVLEAAVTGNEAATEDDRQARDLSPGESVTGLKIRRRRGDRAARALPWVVASVAAAAAIVLYVARAGDRRSHDPVTRDSISVQLNAANTSRPADALIGRIAREDAALASERLDILFADRMAGYRDLRLRRGLLEEDK